METARLIVVAVFAIWGALDLTRRALEWAERERATPNDHRTLAAERRRRQALGDVARYDRHHEAS